MHWRAADDQGQHVAVDPSWLVSLLGYARRCFVDEYEYLVFFDVVDVDRTMPVVLT